MPITTPEPMIKEYRDGEEHFKHVLDCLFKPAIEKAGYIPKPPIAKGSDLIHAEIIKNLETADIILCDMSSLNPNVFFEFGIRTSLNKPVCIVKDELTRSVPFDTSILNHKVYHSTLDPWHLENEINIISDHLTESLERSKGENTLWKYFGLKSEAEPYKVAEGSESKLDYLTMVMDSLREKVDKLTAPSEKPGYDLFSRNIIDNKRKRIILDAIINKMDEIICKDNKHSQEKELLFLDSEFRDIATPLLESTPTISVKRDIMEMFENVSKLMRIYYLQKEPEEKGHLE